MAILVKSRRYLRVPQLLLFGFVAGLALPPSVMARDLPPIRESQAVNGELRNEGDSLSLADRVGRLEGLLEGQALVDMLVRIEELQKEVQELRGQNEVYAHQIEGMKKRQRDLYMDIDRRLRQLLVTIPSAGAGSSAGAGQPGGPQSGQLSMRPSGSLSTQTPVQGSVQQPVPGQSQVGSNSLAASAVAGAQVAVDPQAEQQAYRQAFDVLKEGRYEDSIAAFTRFFQRYPDGQYADNAVYWMGEANYVLRRFPQAIESFNRVLSQYPDSPKLADAMLKIGFSHYEMKDWPEARRILEDLVKHFPASTATQLAKNRLHKMKVDGQ